MGDEQGKNSIRFKSGGVEFELTGSPDQVSKAWEALSDVVTQAFRSPAPAAAAPHAGPAPAPVMENGGGGRKKSTRKRTGGGASQGGGGQKKSDGREPIMTTLLRADLDDLPDVSDAPARFQGYALLRWAKDSHNIGGLTANEMQQFFRDRFGVPNTSNAYRMGFQGKGREVVKISNNPTVFSLMKPGREELDRYLARKQAGGTPAEAAKAAEEGDQE